MAATDVHGVNGTKQYYETFDDAFQDVSRHFAESTCHGSSCSWHWVVNGKVVAEAWMHHTKPGVWLRMATFKRPRGRPPGSLNRNRVEKRNVQYRLPVWVDEAIRSRGNPCTVLEAWARRAMEEELDPTSPTG